MGKYQVIVENVGTVYDGDDDKEAKMQYKECIAISDGEYGRAAGETVAMFEEGEIVVEYEGRRSKERTAAEALQEALNLLLDHGLSDVAAAEIKQIIEFEGLPLFRELDSEEQEEFRQWSRDNYEVGGEINDLWHPVTKDECRRMNWENKYERKTL